MYEITTTNGVTLILAPFEGLETASLGIFIKIGSRYEQKQLRGISHFLEHMLFKGSRCYSHRHIKQEIEGRGGSLNGFTSQEITAYYAHFLKKNIEPTLDILLDMVRYPTLKEEEIKKERNVILEEIKMYNDLPSSRAAAILDTLLWPHHSLGEEVIGDTATVTKINRTDLSRFQKTYYKPCSMVISCSGDFDLVTVSRLLRERIQKSSSHLQLKNIAPQSLQGQHVTVEAKKIEQTHLCVGFRGVSYNSKEKFTIELLNVILGANMSSRLFEEMREKRALCYDISSDARKYHDTGAFVIHAGLDKRNIEVALTIILRELSRIKEQKVYEKELNRAKDYIIGQISMGLERPQGMMPYAAESYITTGKIYTLEEIKHEITNISAAEIRDVSRKIFNFGAVCVSCVGDVEQNHQERIANILQKRR
ncbi:MAG: pitrilysin family protein [Candidatus Omnitrophota bacterium]